jgi:hypothetical protein
MHSLPPANSRRPVKQSVRLFDGQIVDAGVTCLHQACIIEFPVFVAVGTVPLPIHIMPFVGEAHGDTVVRMRPEFLDQPVVEFLGPFAGEKCDDLLSALQEFATVAPLAVRRVGQ